MASESLSGPVNRKTKYDYTGRSNGPQVEIHCKYHMCIARLPPCIIYCTSSLALPVKAFFFQAKKLCVAGATANVC